MVPSEQPSNAESELLQEIANLRPGESVQLEKLQKETREKTGFVVAGFLAAGKGETLPVRVGQAIHVGHTKFSADAGFPDGPAWNSSVVKSISRVAGGYEIATKNSIYLLSIAEDTKG